MDDQERARLKQLYPDWNIRASKNARCYLATRMNKLSLTRDELEAGLEMTIMENNSERLGNALAGQSAIEDVL